MSIPASNLIMNNVTRGFIVERKKAETSTFFLETIYSTTRTVIDRVMLKMTLFWHRRIYSFYENGSIFDLIPSRIKLLVILFTKSSLNVLVLGRYFNTRRSRHWEQSTIKNTSSISGNCNHDSFQYGKKLRAHKSTRDFRQFLWLLMQTCLSLLYA